MKRRTFLSLSAGAAAYSLARPLANAQAPTSGIMSPVLTRAYDNSRTGTTLNETILTQAGIASKGIRKYFSLYMEGDARGAESFYPEVTVTFRVHAGHYHVPLLLSPFAYSTYRGS